MQCYSYFAPGFCNQYCLGLITYEYQQFTSAPAFGLLLVPPQISPQNTSTNSELLTSCQFSRDRKNIVKNFGKAFQKWLKRQFIAGLSQSFDSLISGKRYNNKLIADIIQSEFRAAFVQFLDTAANQWIKYSKIKDRKAHLEAVSLYKNLCLDSKALQQFMLAKSRSRK